jgi:hypothetical protein
MTPLVSVWPRTTTAVALFVDWALQFCVTGVLLAATDTYLRGPLGPLQQTDTVKERHLLGPGGLCECRWRFWDSLALYCSVSAFDWAATGPMFAITAKKCSDGSCDFWGIPIPSGWGIGICSNEDPWYCYGGHRRRARAFQLAHAHEE